MAGNIEQALVQVTKGLEKQVDQAIEQMDNLGVNEIEQLRKDRVKELKALQSKKQEWIQNGHGSYEQLPEEKVFFEVVKKSERVIIHFFTPTNTRSPIVDMHLKILAPKHVETKFASLNAEKCPFLAEKLRIKVIPTLVCIKNTIMVDRIVGFTDLGNRDDFTTDMLEWRLAQNDIINYEADLSIPPDQRVAKKEVKRSIREGRYNGDSDEDLEIEDFINKDKSDVSNGSSKLADPNDLTPEERAELGLDDDE